MSFHPRLFSLVAIQQLATSKNRVKKISIHQTALFQNQNVVHRTHGRGLVTPGLLFPTTLHLHPNFLGEFDSIRTQRFPSLHLQLRCRTRDVQQKRRWKRRKAKSYVQSEPVASTMGRYDAISFVRFAALVIAVMSTSMTNNYDHNLRKR